MTNTTPLNSNSAINRKPPARGPKKTLASPTGQKDVAQYTAELTLELRNLAKAAGLKTLQGLLEVTYYEAFSVAQPAILPEGELEHLSELARASQSMKSI
jgi:hypothetical protein